MVWNNNQLNTYAQVGWIEVPNGNRHTFRESSGGFSADYSWAPMTVNTFSNYTVQYNDPSSGWISYYIDSVLRYSEYNPFAPNTGQVAGETHMAADQMPGGTSSKMYFGNVHIYYFGTWHDFAGTGFNDPSNWYGLNGISTTDFQIWDKSCMF